MYEVVTGIPKSEGMEPPPKIPANPSFVELEEDENAVEKFKKGMANIANVLALDRLRQEVALKEKLAKSGKVLKKRFTVGLVSESPDPGATVRYLGMSVCVYLLPCLLYFKRVCMCLFVCMCFSRRL